MTNRAREPQARPRRDGGAGRTSRTKARGAGKRTGKGSGKARGAKAARRKRAPLYTARTADIHVLYQKAVQDPPEDIKFIDRVFRRERGAWPMVLREDFCGTALMCADWVKSRPGRQAVGVDLHGPTLDWGRRHNLEPLGEVAQRVTLLRQNVLDPVRVRSDVTVAFNFSYCVFKRRQDFVAYCRKVRQELAPKGAFFLDIHGGSDNTEELEERTRHKGFTYVWDQRPYDAITGCAMRHIHFEFPDGTEIRPAFSYDWRIWTLPELTDILEEAGFERVDVYWEGATEEGEGNGIFRRRTSAEQELSWVSYVVAWR